MISNQINTKSNFVGRPIFLIFVFTCAFICAQLPTSFAQGIIITPRPEWRGHVQIEQQNVRAEIVNNVARVETEQIFRNTGSGNIEAEYYFPLPPDAQVSDFLMEINGEEVRGEIFERGQARRIYEDIVRKAKDPALLEYEDYGLFKVRIFPIMPNQPQRVILTYSQILKPESGLVRMEYPMRHSRTGLNRARPALNSEDGFSFQISIEGDIPIASVYSPTDDIQVSRKSPTRVRARMSTDAWWSRRPDKDFILYYQLAERDFAASLIAHRPSRSEPGYFLMMISPPPDPDEHPIARDIVFVLDTSGSMRRDGKIEQAKAALHYGLSRLGPEDRFNVISFNSFVESCFEGLRPADEEFLDEADRFVAGMRPSGGTNINGALAEALSDNGGERSIPIIVFITDGQPTSGITAVDMILKNVRENDRQGRRVFCFGLGYDVNTKLLDRLGSESRGSTQYIEPGENIEARITNLFNKIQYPALERASIECSADILFDTYPHFEHIGDLYRGEQVTIAGRYDKGGEYNFRLTGLKGGTRVSVPFTLHFPEKEYRNEYLAPVWAGRKLANLLEIIRLEGETADLREEIIEISMHYEIPTPYTSYLVTEPEESHPAVVQRRDRDRVEYKRGMESGVVKDTPARAVPNSETIHIQDESRFSANRSPSDPAMRLKASVGKEAVQTSREIADLKAGRFDDFEMSVTRVAGRIFHRSDVGWIDDAFKEGMRITKIKYMSDAYFDLLRSHSNWKELGRLGEHFIIVVNKKLAIEVGPDGEDKLSNEIMSALQKVDE